MINIGLIGYGYWGPNLARNFNSNPDLELAAICDPSPDRLEVASKLYPNLKLYKDSEEIFKDTKLDAVAISTPVSTHYNLAKGVLNAGKHLWLEKPMTETVEQGEQLIELSQKMDKTFLVDHTFVYTGAVRKIKKVIEKGELGKLIYYDSNRVNLGLFQQDVDVIWDLAPHDISIMNFLMPIKKFTVSATGSHFYGSGIVPKSLLTIYMENDVVAHINVSWVSPVKIRQTLIGGTNKMILYDDNEPSEKVKIYDKGVDLYHTKEQLYSLNVQYRIGDMHAPKLETHEALALETEHFVDCLKNGTKPLTGALDGLEVVKVLVASKESVGKRGAPVVVK
jgi:predicted dehydrogenase